MFRVLVVEDDKGLNRAVCAFLGRNGYETFGALNANEAYDAMYGGTIFDIILSDIMMPEIDGVETFQRMKGFGGRSPNLDTPVVMLTANAIVGAKQEYLDLGFTDYLSKPIREEDLRLMLKKYLRPELLKTPPEPESDAPCACASEPVPAAPAPAAEEQPAANRTERIARLAAIGVDTAKGLAYCMSDKDFYLEMLDEYMRSNKRECLDVYYAKKDWNNYMINVHSLKSASLTIGQTELFEKAKALESAAKAGDEAYITANHTDAMERYSLFLEQLGKILD